MGRRKGEGSWGKRIINGTEYITFRKTYDGSPKSFYGKTPKEVKDKIKEFETAGNKISKRVKDKSTFGEYIENWFKNERIKQVEPSTYLGNRRQIDNYIIGYQPYNTQFHLINKEMLQEHIDLLSTKFSRSTVQKAKFIYSLVLSYASENKDIEYNFARDIKIKGNSLFEVQKKDIKFLETEDVNKLFNIADLKNTESYKINSGIVGSRVYGDNAWVCIFIIYTGMRIGEMLALKWGDIDFENKMIKIQHNLAKGLNKDGNKMTYEKGTKGRKNFRYIPLSDRAEYSLTQLKSYRNCVNKNERVFTNNERNVTRTLQSMLIRAGCSVNECGIHALRHTFGSLLLEQGVDIKTISELMGHSDITTTANIYVEVTERLKIKTSEIINKM